MRLVPLLLLLLLPAAAAQSSVDASTQARSLRRAGQPTEAAALLIEARRAAPRDEALAGLLGLCQLDAGRPAEAQAVADEFPGYAGREPRLRTLLGRLAEQAGQWDAALQHFEAALAADGRMLEPAVEVVRTDIAAGRFGAAVTAAARVQAQQPDLGRRLASDAYVAQAERLRSLRREPDKLAAALELRPDDLALAERLLDLQVGLLRVADARALAARLFPEPAGHAQARYWEGRCLAAQADAAGARRAFEEVLAADAGHAGAALELARLDVEAGDFEPARARLAALVAAESDVSRRALLLGLAEEGLGHDVAAEAAFRDVLAREAKNGKALYHLGRLLVRTGRAAEGRAMLETVAKAGPD